MKRNLIQRMSAVIPLLFGEDIDVDLPKRDISKDLHLIKEIFNFSGEKAIFFYISSYSHNNKSNVRINNCFSFITGRSSENLSAELRYFYPLSNIVMLKDYKTCFLNEVKLDENKNYHFHVSINDKMIASINGLGLGLQYEVVFDGTKTQLISI